MVAHLLVRSKVAYVDEVKFAHFKVGEMFYLPKNMYWQKGPKNLPFLAPLPCKYPTHIILTLML